MTAQQIINRALRLIGKLPQGQSPTAGESADGLEALNSMLLRWEASGLTMGFSPVSAVGSTVPIPTEIEECVAYNLAVRLAPEYGAVVPGEVAIVAENGLRALERDAAVIPVVDLDTPKTRGTWDINSGSYI